MLARLKTLASWSLIVFILIGILYLLWSLFFNTVTTVFNVSIDTEYIEYKTIDNNNSRLILKEAYIDTENDLYLPKYTGSLELNSHINVSIERISLGGIEIEANCNECSSVGRLYSDSDELKAKLGSSIYVFIPYSDSSSVNGITHLFRIDGEIDAGRHIGFEQLGESNPILRGGKVDLLGQSRFGNKYFQASTVEVNIGDRIEFDKPLSKSYGFVIINEMAGMKASYRIMAEEMRIIRPGPRTINDGQKFTATFLDSLYNDRFFKAISIIIGTLIFGISIFTFFMDYKSFKKSDNQPPKESTHA